MCVDFWKWIFLSENSDFLDLEIVGFVICLLKFWRSFHGWKCVDLRINCCINNLPEELEGFPHPGVLPWSSRPKILPSSFDVFAIVSSILLRPYLYFYKFMVKVTWCLFSILHWLSIKQNWDKTWVGRFLMGVIRRK